MTEDYSKREWVSRAVLKLAPYIDYPSDDSDQQIVGLAVYDRQAGEAAFVSLKEPSDDVILRDIISDLIDDLTTFQDINRELFYEFNESDANDEDKIIHLNDPTEVTKQME